jgi:high affinity Mn2+ porin
MSSNRTRRTSPFPTCANWQSKRFCNKNRPTAWDNLEVCRFSISLTVLLLLLLPFRLPAQSDGSAKDPDAAPPADETENWNLYYQATSIGQHHGTFNSPYEGPLSLQDTPESDASLTTTLFFGLRLGQGTQLIFDPEIAGGKGFSHVDGLANPSNGELPRVATATPKPYLARLFVSHDFGFGSEKEHFESDENQLAGDRPMTRFTITGGRFSLTDYFDQNNDSHDPRTQFMAWGLMYNGAWDYPADTRGYTWGIVNEFHTKNWSLRYGVAAEPRVANGPQFDRRLFVDQGQTFEEERRYSLGGHAGAIRWLQYLNRSRSGSYAEAVQLAEETGSIPVVQAIRRPGTLKYGTGVSFDQEISHDVGVFSRLGWNDGKTEDFAFTAIDRLAEAGVSVKGTRWKRKDDVVATAFAAAGISGVHAEYLALGGLDFLLGDGKLNYAPEYLWESYYSARVVRGFYATFDVQHYNNPAYNHDRGPVWVESIRLHIEFGIKPLSAK